ncbi:MAG TPA: helix-turn-helix transcriptional regulator [Chloroflexia bacterium]|nr:helix-turn-helix transcriptional regulator [Chloroflexia bacterium]
MLADRLRELRKSRHMTATGLAARAGVSKSFISQLESGRTSASLATLGRIAGVLGVSTGQLLASSTGEAQRGEERAGPRLLYSRQTAGLSPGTRLLSSAAAEAHAVVSIPPGGRARGAAGAGAALVVTGLAGTVAATATTDPRAVEISAGDVAILEPDGAYEMSNQGSGAAVLLVAAPTPADLPEVVRAAPAGPELYESVGPLRLVTMRARRAAERSR